MNKYNHPFFKDRTGEKHITNQGYEVTIIKYHNNSNCTIQFNDISSTTLESIIYRGIKKTRNPSHPTIYDIGYIGQGAYLTHTNGKKVVKYKIWQSVIQRCYSEKFQEKHATYKDCSVAEEWFNFQNFAKWSENNWKPYMNSEWHLDKDILVKGSKIYSSETCAFVPREINNLFLKGESSRGEYPIGVCYRKATKKFSARISKTTKNRAELGLFETPEEAFQAYKIAKEEYIKEVADKWKGQITEQVHQAMYNYQVEITD